MTRRSEIFDESAKSTSDEDKMDANRRFFTNSGDMRNPRNRFFELAANKKGVLRGTYFDIENKTANPIRGIVG